MRPVPRHLAEEGRTERLITQSTILVSFAALATYLWWRVTATLDGAYVPLAVALLAVEMWFGLRHVLAVAPALLLPIGGSSHEPSTVPDVDIIAVVDDEPLRVLRVMLKSCLEVRGRCGLAVVNTRGRAEVDALCRRMGVAVVDPGGMECLGTEPGRRAELLLLVPGSSWVSADVAVMAAPGLDDPAVGAVTLANTTHGLVWLVGTRGYLSPVFGDDRLAARLDRVGVVGVSSGPTLFRKSALRSCGGVCWDAADAVLASHSKLADAGWRSRFLNAPGSYRMAPATEDLALRERARRSQNWSEIGSRAPATSDHVEIVRGSRQRAWQAFVGLAAGVEKWSVLARLGALVIPIVALAAGRVPARVEPRQLVMIGGVWLLSGMVARRRAVGRRQAGGENARIGFRSVGADLAALAGQRWIGRHALLQNVVMGALLAAMTATVWKTVGNRFVGPDGFERFVMLVALLAIPALIRDTVVAYRQQRLLPRVTYESRGRGDIVEVSPEGVDVDGDLPLGSTHAVEFAIPLAGQRLVKRVAPAKVVAHRRRGAATVSHLRMYPDEELAIELAYFCGVTAPTMRWHGFEPRVVRPLSVPRPDGLVATHLEGARVPA